MFQRNDITKELLEKYIESGLSNNQIAEKEKANIKTIAKRVKLYGLDNSENGKRDGIEKLKKINGIIP